MPSGKAERAREKLRGLAMDGRLASAARAATSGDNDNEAPLLADVEGGQEHGGADNGDLDMPRGYIPQPESMDFHTAAQQIMWSRRVLRQFTKASSLGTPALATQKSSIQQDGEDTPDESDEPPPGIFSPRSDCRAIWGLLVSSYMNVFLISIPLGFLAHFLNWGSVAVFTLNFISLVPLALILGEVTEDLAVRFGDIVGGLLNATFGNVVELVLSLAALSKGLYTVVAMSLIGSILSNLLLVLGFCFFLGGIKYKTQKFSIMVNKAGCSLLFLACIALSIPTAASSLYGKDAMPDKSEQLLSRGTAAILTVIYCCYLFFQLKTHGDMFKGEDSDETPSLSLTGALGLLTAITLIVAVASEFLTGALEDVSKASGLNQRFLGLIVLPIAGNACEHITACFVAMKNKMDLSIGVALGSSIQIAIFVLPVCVLAGWVMGRPFTFNFDPFASLILTLAVVHAYFVSSDGQSNWLMGVQLIGTYTLIAILYLVVQS